MVVNIFKNNALQNQNKNNGLQTILINKMMMHLLVVTIIFTSLNSVKLNAQGDPMYGKPYNINKCLDTADLNNLLGFYDEPPYCNSDDDCGNDGWILYCSEYGNLENIEEYNEGSLLISYNSVNETSSEERQIIVGIQKVCFYYRINCLGQLEVQPSNIGFTQKYGIIHNKISIEQVPNQFQIPISFMVGKVLEEILRIGSTNDEYFEDIKNSSPNQFIKTSIGSCWATEIVVKRMPGCTERPPDLYDDGTMGIIIGTPDIENEIMEFGGAPGGFRRDLPIQIALPSECHYYEYYSAPCEGVSCCSELFNVSWNDGNANMQSTNMYRRLGCSGENQNILDKDGAVVFPNIECQPVCDWHNFSIDCTMGIGYGLVSNVYTTNNIINVKILDFSNELNEVDFIITDIYGNEIYNTSAQLSKNLILNSPALPNGNYHIGIFDKNNRLLLNNSITLTGE